MEGSTQQYYCLLHVLGFGEDMTKTDQNERPEFWNEQFMGQILLFRILGKLLNELPQYEEIRNLIQENIFNELPFGGEQPESDEGTVLLEKWSNLYKETFTDQDFDELRSDYTRLFIGPGKVLAPPWESVYYSEERLIFQEQTLKVREWYRRFGLESEKLHNEPDDHIGLELAFLTHLAGLALQVLQDKDSEKLDKILDAKRQFLKAHPLKWAPYWQEEVEKHAQTDFYRGLALLTVGALKALDALLSVEISGESA
jgi:putative dimethyl sulfoxide reductase chaperone